MATKTGITVKFETEPTQPPCECGCGGFPAGKKSRFLPGHDAKLASAHKKAAAAASPAAPVLVKAPDRPRRAARGAAGQDGTARVDGSKA